jgi:glycosyltransferase involved in cell wall biosynthesis
MSPLRVVVVSTEPPDPFGNAAGRWYYVLAKGLSERGSHVRWLSAYTNQQSAERAQTYLSGQKRLELALHPYPKRGWFRQKLRTLRQPYSYFISDGLCEAVDRELRKGYDVLHLEQTWAGWLGMGIPRAVLSVHWLACVDLAGAPAGASRRLAAAALMKWTERHIIANFATIRALSTRDQLILRQMNPNARVAAISLALDHTLYKFSTEEPEEPTLGLIGSMDWLPTRLAAVRLLEDIWPRVKSRVRGLKLLIGGWGARTALAKYLGEPNVTILEDISNVEPFFRQLSMLVFPLRAGSGVKVKVMEAMAYGVPVVTTHEGIEGINAMAGVHAALAEDDDELSIRITELMSDREGRQAMRLAARNLIEEQHSPRSILSQVESLYEDLAIRAPAVPGK